MKENKTMICSGWNKGLTKDNNKYYDKMYSKERNKKISERLKGKKLKERYGEEQANKFIQIFKENATKLKGRKSGVFKKCLICNREIYCYNFEKGWKKFCSRKCFALWQKDNCKINGNKFRLGKEPWNKNKKYVIKNRIYKLCPICKKEFTDLPYIINKKIYCSMKCNNKKPKTEKQLLSARNNGLRQKGRIISEEHRNRLREIKKNQWKDENYRREHINKKRWYYDKLKDIKGERHPNWLGGKSFEPYTKEFNNRFKELIRQRDSFTCLKCGLFEEDCKKIYNQKLHTHHINYDKQLTIKENCCALCLRCNNEVNTNRNQWINFFQSLLSNKYGYKYNNNEPIININYLNCQGEDLNNL